MGERGSGLPQQYAKRLRDVAAEASRLADEIEGRVMACQDVTSDFAVAEDRDHRNWVPGDLVWDPKMGEGHVIVGTKCCDGGDFYCGYCAGMLTTRSHYCEADWPVCECGRFDAGDHHGYTLRRVG